MHNSTEFMCGLQYQIPTVKVTSAGLGPNLVSPSRVGRVTRFLLLVRAKSDIVVHTACRIDGNKLIGSRISLMV
jgi:hypothetical protein